MEYVIDEEKLKEFANNVKFNHPSVAVDWQTDVFLKDKQTVELLVEGICDIGIVQKFDTNGLIVSANVTVNEYDILEALEFYNGKQVKIYIEVSK